MKKNVLPVLIISGLIVIVLIFMGVSALIEKYTPSKERLELSEYYNITEDAQVAISLDNTILDTYGTLIGDHVYLDYSFIHDTLNSRFYWDANENILLYATSDALISANAEASSYLRGKTAIEFGRPIVKATPESALVDLEFVKLFTNISYTVYESPARIVITSVWEDITVADTKKDTCVRLKGGIKSPILTDLEKGTSCTILEKGNKWHKVATTDGIIGYVSASDLKKPSTKTLVSDFEEEGFAHIFKDKPINLVWHQVMNSSANDKISSVLSRSKGVNVISPTWFKVSDNEGNISSIASADYVKYCHDHNVEVWGLISNIDNGDDVSTPYVLTHTSTRHNLVNQIVAKAIEYKLDGINVDIEYMSGDSVGDAYIQFLRELSIRLHDNDISLSADVLQPSASNWYYYYEEQQHFVDYVVVMAYDQHYSQRSGEGSTAALDWTTDVVDKLLKEGVPSRQILLGVPFYTKLWALTPTTEDESAEITYLLSWDDIGMNSAKKWMNENVDEPQWLEDCGQYYGQVTKDGVIYKLWLEDLTSLELRLKLMQEKELAGCAFWKAGLEDSDAWDVILKYIN